MNALQSYLHNVVFTVYPYLCLAVFFMGSLARFNRDQYTWKSDSSQLLRTGTLRWGSNLFHVGILSIWIACGCPGAAWPWVEQPSNTTGSAQLSSSGGSAVGATGCAFSPASSSSAPSTLA